MHFKTIDFSKYSSINIGQPEEVLVLEKCDQFPDNRYLIGGANNLLISPAPPPMMILGKSFAYIDKNNNEMEIGAAMPTGRIVSYAKKNNIGGFEFFSKLPGTLGGMLAMNAGVKEYEIFNILHSLEINGKWVKKEDIEHGYRYTNLPGIVTAAKFFVKNGFDAELLKSLISLRSNQPKEPSAGSVFKNPKGDFAGRLIDAVGLKGKEKGDMAWSEIHANFLVNKGNGKFEDAIYLIKMAKDKVYEKFGILLQEEIKIL